MVERAAISSIEEPVRLLTNLFTKWHMHHRTEQLYGNWRKRRGAGSYSSLSRLFGFNGVSNRSIEAARWGDWRDERDLCSRERRSERKESPSWHESRGVKSPPPLSLSLGLFCPFRSRRKGNRQNRNGILSRCGLIPITGSCGTWDLGLISALHSELNV